MEGWRSTPQEWRSWTVSDHGLDSAARHAGRGPRGVGVRQPIQIELAPLRTAWSRGNRAMRLFLLARGPARFDLGIVYLCALSLLGACGQSAASSPPAAPSESAAASGAEAPAESAPTPAASAESASADP